MASKPEDKFKFEWLRAVAKLRLGSSMKSVAAYVSHHANKDGSNIHPGVRLLAEETELSERTVRSCLTRLRELGLIVRVAHGSVSERRRYADKYKLALPADLEARLSTALEGAPDQPLVARRGSAANHVRWHERRGKTDPKCALCAPAQTGSVDLPANPTTGNTESETTGNTDPTTGPYRSTTNHKFTNHGHRDNTSPLGAAVRASSRVPAKPYPAFFAEAWNEMVQPGETLTADDEDWIRQTIDRDYVEAELADLDAVEESTVIGMLANGSHPAAVINTIRKARGEAA